MNFLNIKFWICVIVFLGLALLGSGVEIWRLKGDVERAQAEMKALNLELAAKEANLQISQANLSECTSNIALQNERIAKMAVDNNMLNARAKKLKKELEAKFKQIKPPDVKNDAEVRHYYESVFKEMGR